MDNSKTPGSEDIKSLMVSMTDENICSIYNSAMDKILRDM